MVNFQQNPKGHFLSWEHMSWNTRRGELARRAAATGACGEESRYQIIFFKNIKKPHVVYISLLAQTTQKGYKFETTRFVRPREN